MAFAGNDALVNLRSASLIHYSHNETSPYSCKLANSPFFFSPLSLSIPPHGPNASRHRGARCPIIQVGVYSSARRRFVLHSLRRSFASKRPCTPLRRASVPAGSGHYHAAGASSLKTSKSNHFDSILANRVDGPTCTQTVLSPNRRQRSSKAGIWADS